MSNIVITRENGGWDITAYQNGKPVKKAWGYDRSNAIGKAEIFADFYRDENGQSGSIIINDK